MKSPRWWYQNPGIMAWCLMPLAWAYRCIGRLRAWCAHARSPVIATVCIGNVVAGGGGKTPVALAIGALCRAHGLPTWGITRGYGGRVRTPTIVCATHTAEDVGDEALLLARVLPTVCGRRRADAVALAAAYGAALAVMDDGLQHPYLRPTRSLLVLKGPAPLGNGCLLPAGPLREPLESALRRVQAVVWVDPPETLPYVFDIPVFRAHTALSVPAGVQRAVAFAGIARPELFRDALERSGVELLAFRAFADHAVVPPATLEALVTQARAAGVPLLTTEKDYVRLPLAVRTGVVSVPLLLTFEAPDAVMDWVRAALPAVAHHASVA